MQVALSGSGLLSFGGGLKVGGWISGQVVSWFGWTG